MEDLFPSATVEELKERQEEYKKTPEGIKRAQRDCLENIIFDYSQQLYELTRQMDTRWRNTVASHIENTLIYGSSALMMNTNDSDPITWRIDKGEWYGQTY